MMTNDTPSDVITVHTAEKNAFGFEPILKPPEQNTFNITLTNTLTLVN